MNTTLTHPIRRMLCVAACFMVLVGAARAQFVPLNAISTQVVIDATGAYMPSSSSNLVHFLRLAQPPVVYPPAVDGAPHPDNEVIFSFRIGGGVATDNPSLDGLFSASISPRPEEGDVLVARVYNAPTLEAASFYTDSQPFTVNFSEVFYPLFPAATNAFDTADDDGDGVHNSWEKALGGNSSLWDSDGDGMSDLEEFRAGTALGDPNRYLAMDAIAGGSVTLRIAWESVSGKTYQVQAAPGSLNDPLTVFTNIGGPVAASGPLSSIVLTNGAGDEVQQFRIRLVD
jgi:hypothetical protein